MKDEKRRGRARKDEHLRWLGRHEHKQKRPAARGRRHDNPRFCAGCGHIIRDVEELEMIQDYTIHNPQGWLEAPENPNT